MLTELLQELERNELPQMLRGSVEEWNSVDIDFHLPRVERLWRPWRHIYRINLHVIHPCTPEESLYHPHAWPAAIHVLKERYRMFTGYGTGDTPPPQCYFFNLLAGTYYEMIHPDAWHAECPIDMPVLTVTLSGKPWPRSAPKSPHILKPLDMRRKEELLGIFSSLLI